MHYMQGLTRLVYTQHAHTGENGASMNRETVLMVSYTFHVILPPFTMHLQT